MDTLEVLEEVPGGCVGLEGLEGEVIAVALPVVPARAHQGQRVKPAHNSSILLGSHQFSSLLLTSPHFFSLLLITPHVSSLLLIPPYFSSFLLTSPHFSSLLLASPHFSSRPPAVGLALPEVELLPPGRDHQGLVPQRLLVQLRLDVLRLPLPPHCPLLDTKPSQHCTRTCSCIATAPEPAFFSSLHCTCTFST